MINTSYLALGSNMGDRESNLINAIRVISSIDSISVIDISNIYETDPVGYTQQDKFLNMAAVVQTTLQPLRLLEELQKIENRLKRKREIFWGPRTIDIDILLYGDIRIDLPNLVIPHPRMFERAFVLVPTRDIFEGKVINGEDIDDLIDKCSDKYGVKEYKKLTIDILSIP